MTLGSAASMVSAPTVRLHCVSVSGAQYPPLVLRQTPPDAVPTNNEPVVLGAIDVTRPASIIGPELKKPLSAWNTPLGPSDRHPLAMLAEKTMSNCPCRCAETDMRARSICAYGRSVDG